MVCSAPERIIDNENPDDGRECPDIMERSLERSHRTSGSGPLAEMGHRWVTLGCQYGMSGGAKYLVVAERFVGGRVGTWFRAEARSGTWWRIGFMGFVAS